MNQSNEISKEACKKIATKIRLDIFKPANTYKITVFLCGADISLTDKIRYNLAKELTTFRYSYLYDLIYPEDIFEELLYSSHSNDLLTLENLLAESVDAIVIIPESPGSFTELGAFANDENLRTKLICIVDKKYKKNKSFINQGPLKLVKKTNKNGLLFIDPNEIEKEVDRLNTVLKKMKKGSGRVGDKITLLQIDNFLLPTIFLLEPVSKTILINLVGYATENEKNAYQSTTTALTMLTKKRHVELTPVGYKLTSLGVKEFLRFQHKSKRIKTQKETVILDELRLEILNLKNRKKKLKV
ncbi:MAG: retron St85 family effector protein [Bacteroidales bacterium]|jgi:hypothetical protein|nr:retron St85 family effector protein [Bacteroidales bacterium]